MIIKANSSKETIKQEIANLKDSIRLQRDYVHKIEVMHRKKMRREYKVFKEYADRLAKMQLLLINKK